MKTGLELLTELFANVPGPDESVHRERGRVLENNAVIAVAGIPIPDPVGWMMEHGMPLERTLPRGGPYAGAFVHGPTPHIELCDGDQSQDPKVQRVLWHEIGHAIDFMSVSKAGVLTHLPDGQYSTKHKAILVEHAELIVALRIQGDIETEINSWSRYAREPKELWAELVAIACTNPKAIVAAPKLWAAVWPDMTERCLPIPTEDPRPPVSKYAEGLAAMEELRPFMGESQRQAVLGFMRGEEKEYFCNAMIELAEVIRNMPKTYDTQHTVDPIVHLHYFAGGQANWYITEKDKGHEDDAPGEEQMQAFGLADLFGDGGELGYIPIPEILRAGGELDFHWTPQPLSAVRKKQFPDEEQSPTTPQS